MSNLFSVFNPFNSFFMVNLLSSLILLLFFPTKFWYTSSSIFYLMKLIIKFLYLEFSMLLTPLNTPGMNQYFLSLFSFIWINNMVSLFPYIFSCTAHPFFAMVLMLPVWTGQFIFSWMKTPYKMLAHLVPEGTPMFLTPLMVLIELVSNLIRPLTLTVRLVANISAGHLLLVLIGSLPHPLSFKFMFILIMVGVASAMMMMLELCVSLIQAYVFSMLLTLFIKEVNFL